MQKAISHKFCRADYRRPKNLTYNDIGPINDSEMDAL